MLLDASTVLAADDLTVELGGLPVLRGVSLSVKVGEAVALMGGNGSGKSTLVRTLLGLLPTNAVRYACSAHPGSFRQWSRVGYVPQRSMALLGGSKVKEVVAAGRLARRRPFRPLRPEDRAAIHDAIALVGLSEQLNADIAALSGGQQQRVLVARHLPVSQTSSCWMSQSLGLTWSISGCSPRCWPSCCRRAPQCWWCCTMSARSATLSIVPWC